MGKAPSMMTDPWAALNSAICWHRWPGHKPNSDRQPGVCWMSRQGGASVALGSGLSFSPSRVSHLCH